MFLLLHCIRCATKVVVVGVDFIGRWWSHFSHVLWGHIIIVLHNNSNKNTHSHTRSSRGIGGGKIE